MHIHCPFVTSCIYSKYNNVVLCDNVWYDLGQINVCVLCVLVSMEWCFLRVFVSDNVALNCAQAFNLLVRTFSVVCFGRIRF